MVGDIVKNVCSDEIMLACASEDADWLARGVMEGMGKGSVPLSVFWNDRATVFENESEKIEITPIVKSYEEPIEHCRVLIVVKSIISSSCVVKTQLTRLVGKTHPEHIVIVSPVMYKDGIPNLKAEFPGEISDKFQFLTFAVDDDRNDSGEVLPGVGGMVYPRLGLGDLSKKNSHLPQLVLGRM